MKSDFNYNAQIFFEDSSSSFIFVNRLSNEGLDNWQGWRCAAGVNSIYIYKNQIYGGECKNDYLGQLDTNFTLLEDYTICKQKTCSGCTPDLLQEKYKP